MLRMYVIDQPSKWEDYIHLVEFSYNNGYQASLKMRSLESLYGRKCNTPVSWDNLADMIVIGLDTLKEMEELMEKIEQNLKAAHDKKKRYADKNRFFIEFKVGEHVFFKSESEKKFAKVRKLPEVGSKIL
jgi:hypothetical protein